MPIDHLSSHAFCKTLQKQLLVMSRKHGAYHFEEESQNSPLKPDSSNQYTRFRTYIVKREIDPIPILIGLLLGILLTLCFTAIIGFFHHAQTLETIESFEEKKNSAIQNLTDNTEYRIKVLSSDIVTFSNDLQNLYRSIENHTSPGGELTSAKEYLDHIRQLGEKLEECQSIGDELMECKNKTRNTFKKYNLSEIEQNIRIVAGNYTPEIGKWIEEQINFHTTDDGTSRDKAQICKSLRQKFKLKHGGYWTCFFSHFYAFNPGGFSMSVTFNDDKDVMAQTLETIESIEEEKNSAIQNLTDNTEYRIKALSLDLFNFSSDLQNLYDSIENHTSPGGELTSAKEYVDHIRQIGEKLEECQLIGDELMECKNETRNSFKKYTLSEIEQNIRVGVGNYNPEIGKLIEEQINSHTTDDGATRDKGKICISLRDKFKLKYGGYWTCFFSHFYSFNHGGFFMNVTFNDDKDMMVIYKE